MKKFKLFFCILLSLTIFNNLKTYTTQIRKPLTKDAFGIGLRLSNDASIELLKNDNLKLFKKWLNKERLYIFTINGFPYGSFHNKKIKDKVHLPDWTTNERVNYTNRLILILKELLPTG